MIRSYRDRRTESFARGEPVRAFGGFAAQAWRRPEVLDAAETLQDLRALIMSRPPIHPGEILAEELSDLGLSASELARQLQVPPNRISQIIKGRRSITGDTALQLGHWFGSSPQFWLNLQAAHDLRLAEAQVGEEVERLPRRAA